MRTEGLIESRPNVGVRVVVEGENWTPPPGYEDRPHDVYIESVLRERLNDGRLGKGIYRPGGWFSPASILAEEFGVSPATIRKAITPLKDQNILVTVGNRRTIVSPDLDKFSAEELLRAPVRRKPGWGKLEAFGETRSISEWVKDPRCRVSREVLHSRYTLGWEFERALTTPKQFTRVHPPKPWKSTQDAYVVARQSILSGISDGTHRPGVVISTVDLAARLKIPEAVVDEALADLRDLEVVEYLSDVGYYVSMSALKPISSRPDI
ncbi:hypothetical protein ACH3Y9_12620 [Streptomyces sp. WSLK1-5]|uniref:hypothetical protein n=1 Tax=unclassified Streptomyces TaxID=2593676 RepID=UPI0037900A01